MTSVATAAVRPGASSRVATATVRPGAPLRARLAFTRARVRAHASASLPAVAAASASLGLGSPAVRLATSPRRARGGSLVAGGAEKSSSAETSTAAESDDVDALAERLDKLKEKSRAMLAEAEALEKSATATETAAGDASAEPSAETAATAKATSKASEKSATGVAAGAAAKKAADTDPDVSATGNQADWKSGASVVESTRVLAGVVAGASALAVGGSYAAGATSLLATEPVLALFGSAAAFAAVSVIDAVTPALEKREAAAEAAAKAAKAANPAARKPPAAAKISPPAKEVGAKEKEAEAKTSMTSMAVKKTSMPAPVNKPVDASAAKRAAAEDLEDVGQRDVGSVIKKKETPSSPAGVSMRAATPDPTKADTQWLDPADAARMSGAALTPGADGAAESLVKKDTASRVSSPFASAFSPLGAGGASVAGSADEVKLEELRAIATQRMAKQRMYEEYVKARPAAAGGGARMSVFGENKNETAKKTSDAAASSPSGSPLARFLKLVFFPLLLPFAIVKFALRLIRNLLGGGKAAGAQ